MQLLCLEQLYYQEHLIDINLELRHKQRLALVGENGSGKTTLLKLMAGQLQADQGHIDKLPGTSIAYVEQDSQYLPELTVWQLARQSLAPLEELEQRIRLQEEQLADDPSELEAYGRLLAEFERLGGYQAQANLVKALEDFGFDASCFERRLASLSGGEQRRLDLAVALSANTELLLLDEPSNHLDFATQKALVKALKRYPGAFVLASHDRALLDACSQETLVLQQGALTHYRGNYSQVRQRLEGQLWSLQRHAKASRKEVQRLQRSAHTLRRHGSATRQRQRKTIEKRIARLEADIHDQKDLKKPDLPLVENSGKGVAFEVKQLSYGDVVKDQSFRINHADHIGLLGANGSGKSTLLKLIAGDIASDSPDTTFFWSKQSKLFVLDQQQQGVDPSQTPLEQLVHVSETRAKMLLSLVGVPERQWSHLPEQLSGGERARLGVALLIASEANILLLDEPSNHLDIKTIETLEAALKDSQAAFILVSHDQRLLENVCQRIWQLEAGKLVEYRGGFEGYVAGRRRLEEGLLEASVQLTEQTADEKDDVENQLMQLETEFSSLKEELLDPYLLSERERQRARQRYREVFEALSELHEQRQSAPEPSYNVTLKNVHVSADYTDSGSIAFTSNSGLKAVLYRRERVGHLVLKEESLCLLAWAFQLALEAICRISFEHLEVSTLQLQSTRDLRANKFEDAGHSWWIRYRSAYEQDLGFRPAIKKRRRRRRRKGRKT